MNVATMERVRPFAKWQSVALGSHPGPSALRNALLGENCTVSFNASCALFSKDFEVAQRKSIDLVIVTPRDLGCIGGTALGTIYQKAQLLGLDLCPSETAAALLLQHHDKFPSECLRVAMQPLRYCRNEDLFVICNHDGVLSLDTCVGQLAQFIWADDVPMVFSLP